MARFQVAVYKAEAKAFVIVGEYDDINAASDDYGREVLSRGENRVMLLEQLDVSSEVRVSVLRNKWGCVSHD